MLNTIADLGAAANHTMAAMGYPQHSPLSYPAMVGNGVAMLIERALPDEARTPEIRERALEIFRQYYDEHLADNTVPYPGIALLLDELTARGVRVAVASNKFQRGTEKLVRRFFPAIPFVAVLGQRPDVPLKPDPAVVHEILTQCGIPAEKTLYVGDSGIDIETARAAGVRSVGVTWGFRSREELQQAGAGVLVDRSEELLRLL